MAKGVWARIKEWAVNASKLGGWRIGLGEQAVWRKVAAVYYSTLVSNPNISVLCLPYQGS